MNIKSNGFGCVFILIILTKSTYCQIPKNYKGQPFHDSVYGKGAQAIPGRVELAYYDIGGEGVAYKDTTPENEGSKLNHTTGHLRPGVSKYIAFFRENESVDISYTKDWADFNHPNKVDPAVNQLYIGWQADGEWTNYTVDVRKSGRYRIITVYGYRDNKSELWINEKFATKLFLPEDTGNWHNWTQASVGEIEFTVEGLNLLTLKYNSGSNLAYLDFVLIEPTK